MMQEPNEPAGLTMKTPGSPIEGQHGVRSSRRLGSGGRQYMNNVNQAFEASYSRGKGGGGGGGGGGGSNRHLLANKFSLGNDDV
jgi:hypothetical protein